MAMKNRIEALETLIGLDDRPTILPLPTMECRKPGSILKGEKWSVKLSR